MSDDPNFDALVKHVATAIEKGLNLGVQYQGLSRLVTPWLLGETRDTRTVLHAFQFGGMTSSGAIADPSQGVWRWLYLDEFEGLAAGAGPAYPMGLQKSEEEFQAPAFITQVIAVRES